MIFYDGMGRFVQEDLPTLHCVTGLLAMICLPVICLPIYHSCWLVCIAAVDDFTMLGDDIDLKAWMAL